MAQLIELNTQDHSPFESEPQLLGVYHWSEGLRSMHKHDDRLELNFILSGNGTQVIGGELCHVQEGDVLIHNAGVLHDESLMLYSQVEAWCIAVKGLKLPSLQINELVPKNFHPRIPCQAVAEELAKLYPLVHHHAQQPDGYPIANLLARAVVLIVYNVMRSTALAVSEEKNFIIERVRNYIEEHYDEDFSRADLKDLVPYNEYYFSRLFKDATGYTPKEYITRRRIGKAQCLLIYTSLPLMEISSRVGYDDPNYFGKMFKKIIGMSPLFYRKKWRELSSGSVPSDV